MGDPIGSYKWVIKGDSRSLDYSSYSSEPIIPLSNKLNVP